MTDIRSAHDADQTCACVTDHNPNPMELHRHHILPLSDGGPRTADNEVWLCLEPSMRVLMADGQLVPIASVAVGESVMGYDGKPAEVSGRTQSWFSGQLVDLDGLAVTPNHPVLTPSGWRRADRIGHQEAVLAEPFREGVEPHVLRLIRAQPEVVETVVERIEVDVVHDLLGRQPSAQRSLVDVSVLGDDSTLVSVPDDDLSVTSSVDPAGTLVLEGPRNAVQRSEPALVGAELLSPVTAALLPELSAALLTRRHTPRPLPSEPGALLRTSAVGARRHAAGHLEGGAAHGARLADHGEIPTNEARWNALDHVGSVGYSGWVYDITVPRCGAFFAEGALVHNCPTSHSNVHELYRAHVKYEGAVPWDIRKRFSPYIRGLAAEGYRRLTGRT